jgi:Polyketide cyclase / dehydrase and lipid transport
MRPMMRLVLGLGALVVILAGVALALPDHVTVARSVVINAPEPVVFPYLNNLHRFNAWSPWAARDPNLQVTFAGPDEGKGARLQWTSDKRSVGSGSLEITGSTPNRHVDLAVDHNGLGGTSYYEVAPSGSGSKVTWGFGYETGASPLKRWKGLLLDGFVGADYGVGLAKLKDVIESERRPTAPAAPVAGSEPPGAASSAAAPPASPAGAPPLAAPAQPAAPPAAQQPVVQPAPPPPPPAPSPPPKRTRR